MIDNTVVINGFPLDEPYNRPGNTNGDSKPFQWQRQYLVANANYTEYWPTLRDWGPLVIPNDSHFVMGDNRGASVDSRQEGFVHMDRFVGRVRWITLSYGSPASEPMSMRESIRWPRIGSVH